MSASLEEKCKNNHALVVKLNTELAHTKDHVNTLNITKKALEDKVASLNVNISDLQKKLHDVEIVSRENVVRYDMIFAQRTNFFAKIKDLEDKFLKRGQTDQTIHMNQPKEFAHYNAKKGIGYKSPCHLQRAISKSPTMYDFRYMSLGLKMTFMKNCDDPEKVAEKNSFRKQKVSIPFEYRKLNSSYATRVIPLSDDYIGNYTQKEYFSNNPIKDHVISKVTIDNRTFYEKRIEKLEKNSNMRDA